VDQRKALLWQPILAKYHPAFLGECQKALQWSDSLARDWLATGMFSEDPNSASTIDNIIKELVDHALNFSHARHISMAKAMSIGLKVIELESNPDLQDLVLSVHHSAIHPYSFFNAGV